MVDDFDTPRRLHESADAAFRQPVTLGLTLLLLLRLILRAQVLRAAARSGGFYRRRKDFAAASIADIDTRLRRSQRTISRAAARRNTTTPGAYAGYSPAAARAGYAGRI